MRDRLTGLLSDLELNRPSSLLLHYRCAGCHLVALPDIRYSQFGVPTSPIEWDNVILYGQYVLDRARVR